MFKIGTRDVAYVLTGSPIIDKKKIIRIRRLKLDAKSFFQLFQLSRRSSRDEPIPRLLQQDVRIERNDRENEYAPVAPFSYTVNANMEDHSCTDTESKHRGKIPRSKLTRRVVKQKIIPKNCQAIEIKLKLTNLDFVGVAPHRSVENGRASDNLTQCTVREILG